MSRCPQYLNHPGTDITLFGWVLLRLMLRQVLCLSQFAQRLIERGFVLITPEFAGDFLEAVDLA